MQMILQKFKQNTIRFIVTHPLLVAFAKSTIRGLLLLSMPNTIGNFIFATFSLLAFKIRFIIVIVC